MSLDVDEEFIRTESTKRTKDASLDSSFQEENKLTKSNTTDDISKGVQVLYFILDFYLVLTALSPNSKNKWSSKKKFNEFENLLKKIGKSKGLQY